MAEPAKPKPCGCIPDQHLCPQHLQALPLHERLAWLRRHAATARSSHPTGDDHD